MYSSELSVFENKFIKFIVYNFQSIHSTHSSIWKIWSTVYWLFSNAPPYVEKVLVPCVRIFLSIPKFDSNTNRGRG